MPRPAIIISDQRWMPVQTVSRYYDVAGNLYDTVVTYPNSYRRDVVKPASESTSMSVHPRIRTNFSSYSYSGSIALVGHCDVTYVVPGAGYSTIDGVVLTPMNDVDFSGASNIVSDRAINKALISLLDQDNSVNFAINLGEYKEVAGMMVSTTTRIAKQIRNFKGGLKGLRTWPNVKKTLNAWRNPYQNGELNHIVREDLRGAVNGWLEMQYGWKPLAQDVFGAVKQLKRDYERGLSPAIRVSEGAKQISASSQVAYEYDSFRIDWKVRLEEKARAVFYYHLDDPIRAIATQTGLTDPLQVAWELAPYSFVVDWFLPVGDFLQARTADYGWAFEGGSVSTLQKMSARGHSEGGAVFFGPWKNEFSRLKPLTASGHRFYRVLYNSSNPPTARPPHFKNPLSYGHVANALSLLVNAID